MKLERTHLRPVQVAYPMAVDHALATPDCTGITVPAPVCHRLRHPKIRRALEALHFVEGDTWPFNAQDFIDDFIHELSKQQKRSVLELELRGFTLVRLVLLIRRFTVLICQKTAHVTCHVTFILSYLI
jgi:hypothetical protein